MVIALPNLDGSFTVTLFLSYAEGEYNFNNLTTPEMYRVLPKRISRCVRTYAKPS